VQTNADGFDALDPLTKREGEPTGGSGSNVFRPNTILLVEIDMAIRVAWK
jgi:hypothetical protein